MPVTSLWISTALEQGFDGIMLMGCKSGDDYQCHFVKGSAIAKERMANVGETLKSLMLEEERAAVEAEADVIATPCPLFQTNVEMYQDAINAKYGTDFHIPVVFYSQLMTVAFAMDGAKDAALDQNTIRSEMLEKLAQK
jgi:hypothetical protein